MRDKQKGEGRESESEREKERDRQRERESTRGVRKSETESASTTARKSVSFYLSINTASR